MGVISPVSKEQCSKPVIVIGGLKDYFSIKSVKLADKFFVDVGLGVANHKCGFFSFTGTEADTQCCFRNINADGSIMLFLFHSIIDD